MTIKQKLEKLANEKNTPCITISLNTHRTHPDNSQDEILLKNLLKEAEERVVTEYGKRPVEALLANLALIEKEVDVNYNLDSLHIFLSNDTKEIIRLACPTNENTVQMSDSFAMRTLIKAYNRSEEYLILLLSQNGVSLFEALNDGIVKEIKNTDFPFPENKHHNSHHDKGDSKHMDDSVREFLNNVDKAVVKVHNEKGLNCIVVCTEDNYSRLIQIADKPAIYLGHAKIDYNHTDKHHIAKQGWEIVGELLHNRRKAAIGELKEAVSQGKVITDLQEIYQASIDGRGDLLMVHDGFSQSVLMTSERTFDKVADASEAKAIDDITSNIAWEVLSKKGQVFFTTQDEIKEIGDIVLKTRF